MQKRILIVDDEPAIRDMVAFALRKGEYDPVHAGDAREAQMAIVERVPDLILLDWMLPGTSGIDLARRWRKDELTRDIPIIMLTARGEVMDRVVGLELGADDYVPKPFEPRELVARVQTVLRRRVAPPAAGLVPGTAARLVFDGLVLDPATRSVQRQGELLELTSTEFDLLHLLAREAGKVFSRDDILNHLRGHEAELYTRAVDIVVSRLRKKLEPLDCIKTLRNAGYSLALGRSQA